MGITNEQICLALRKCVVEGTCIDCPLGNSRERGTCKSALFLTVASKLTMRDEEEEKKSGSNSLYWNNICDLNARQEEKGLKKYGVLLEDNTTLTTEQRIEHLEEELIDALKYCEHLKTIANDGITANDYQRAAMRTAGDDKSSYLLNGVMGLCGEAGEVIDLVKKHLHQGHDLDKEKIAEECSDCLWYCALIASALDMKLGDIMQMNIDKLKKRFPDGFSKERSINREE